MPTFDLKITIPRLAELKSKFQQAPSMIAAGLDTAVKMSAGKIVEEVKKETPVKTGYLKGGIIPAFSFLKAIIAPRAKYSVYVHEGTRPHDIYPVRKKALFWKGALHPVMHVHHPGTKANPFMVRGLANARPEVEDIFKQVIDKTLEKLT